MPRSPRPITAYSHDEDEILSPELERALWEAEIETLENVRVALQKLLMLGVEDKSAEEILDARWLVEKIIKAKERFDLKEWAMAKFPGKVAFMEDYTQLN